MKQKKTFSGMKRFFAAALMLCLAITGMFLGEVRESKAEEPQMLIAQKAENQSGGTAKSTPKRRTDAQKLAAKARRAALGEGTKHAQTPSQKTTDEQTATSSEADDLTVRREVRCSVDFDELHEMNKEIVAWIFQAGTEFSFPIVQHDNNEYYLTHSYTDARNKTGTIFADCDNSPLFTDECTYLYGTSEKKGAMFASLPNYVEHDYWQEHPTMLLITPDGDVELEIFACVRESGKAVQTWSSKQFAGQSEYDEFIDSVLEKTSLHTGIVPQWGEQLLALCTCERDERFVVFARMRPIEYTTDQSASVTKMQLDSLEGTSRMIEVPGRGMMQYYAQNDPVWAKMVYEPKGATAYRPFGQGGCCPTSVAMAIANLVPEENLNAISAYARSEQGFTFCRCSVNQYYCDRTHEQYQLTTGWEFKRYLPIVMANFATGNNRWNAKSRSEYSGTSVTFVKRLTEVYGLELTVSKSGEEAVEALRRGAMVVASTGGSDSPFTGGGHFLTLAHADDTYLYILDPYLKDDYSKTDKRKLLTQLQPGLLRADIAEMDHLLLYTFFILENPAKE